MYDYEFIIPTEVNNEVILKRIADFKKFGIINHEGFKIKIFLMASRDNPKNQLEKNWPKDFDVQVIITPFEHVAQRIYWYYATIMKPDTAKWYVRIDEDSLTDIAGLDRNLKLMFDHEREFHVVGHLNWDIWDADEAILRSLGYGHFYRHHSNHRDTPPHEQEISVTSNAAIKKMFSNEKAVKYFDVRKEFADGYGDHGLCHCLRMNKIYPVSVSFLTHEAELVNYSGFGGFRNHIHHVSRDASPKILDWLELFNRNPCPEDECTYLMGRRHLPKNWVRLAKEKTVNMMRGNDWAWTNQGIGIWCKTKEDEIAFYNEHDPIIYFKKQNEDLWTWEDFELRKINSTI